MYIKDLNGNKIEVTDLKAAISQATQNVHLSKACSKDAHAAVKYIGSHPIEEYHSHILNQLKKLNQTK